jgi:hypothetical protein
MSVGELSESERGVERILGLPTMVEKKLP